MFPRGKAKKIQDLFDKISTVPDLNRGGCLIGALAVYLALKKEGINVGITQLALFSEENLIEHNKNFLEGKNKNACSSAHYMIKYGNEYYDSDGLFFKKELLEKYFLLNIDDNIEDFCISALNNSTWNPRYDRDYNEYISIKLNLKGTVFDNIKIH